MRPFTDAQLLELWESGIVQHPVDRALTFLLALEPGQTRLGLAELPLGQRDARLLEAYRLCFGARLEGIAACPACGAQLEFSVDTAGLAGGSPAAGEGGNILKSGDYSITFRPPNSLDLAAAAQAPDETSASRLLLTRCVLGARRGGRAVGAGDLPEAVAEALEERIAESDPQAELLFNLSCPACAHAWQESLDVPGFFWAQVAARARRLLVEVHTLAAAYGWSEGEILALGAQRRQAYLEMAG